MRVPRPYRLNFVFRQDGDFQFVYRLKNPDGSLVNVSGWTVEMQVRATLAGNVLATLSTGSGHITLGGSNGTITIAYPKATIAGLGWTAALFDIRETPPAGRATYRFTGGISVVKQVTRG